MKKPHALFCSALFFTRDSDCCVILGFTPHLGALDHYVATLDNKIISEKEAVLLFFQIGHALSHLHSINQVVHMDINPANLLVSRSGDVLLSDFGLSKKMEQKGIIPLDRCSGTPGYMHPHLTLTESPVDATTPEIDYWSLMITIHELTNKKEPFPFVIVRTDRQLDYVQKGPIYWSILSKEFKAWIDTYFKFATFWAYGSIYEVLGYEALKIPAIEACDQLQLFNGRVPVFHDRMAEGRAKKTHWN
ncbi:Rho-associated protein kinase [Halotydeus destructor]|nr:Rho-associated protein kinase [Halotydeus destructor]